MRAREENRDRIIHNQALWNSRDAWFCFATLIAVEFVLPLWIHAGARHSWGFYHLLMSPSGQIGTAIVHGGIWLFVALWFSRVDTGRDFLGPAGFQKGIDVFGCCGALVVMGIAFIDGYGASKGWTASTKQPHPIGYEASGMVWGIFAFDTVLLVPFYEEAVTRGFMFRAFRTDYGFWRSIFLILLFSGCCHWRTISLSLFSCVCLISLWTVLCVVRERSGSFWSCFMCHAVYNAVGINLWLEVAILMLLFLWLLHVKIVARSA